MVCSKCGTEYNDNSSYCPGCGTPNPVNGGRYYNQEQDRNMGQGQNKSEPVYQMPDYQSGYYQSPDYRMPDRNNGYEPPVKIGQYIGWMLLAYALGPISFIITIIMACIGGNKNRANFFRANLIMWLVFIALAVIIGIVFSAIGFSYLDGIDYDFYDLSIFLIR